MWAVWILVGIVIGIVVGGVVSLAWLCREMYKRL